MKQLLQKTHKLIASKTLKTYINRIIFKDPGRSAQ